MTTYRDSKWSKRYATMGDTAEEAFLQVHPYAHRLGLNRPNFDVRGMSEDMRYTPDFMVPDCLYEVMGVASRGDSTLKFKLDKASSLQTWECIGPVRLWIYDSSKKRYWDGSLTEWLTACHKSATFERFVDNKKPYFALHISEFPVEEQRPETGV
jgi:hypothetical protein